LEHLCQRKNQPTLGLSQPLASKKSGSLVFYGLNDYIAGEFAGFYGALQVYFGRLSQQWDWRI